MPAPFTARSPDDIADRATLLSMSGLAFIRAMLDGHQPMPAIVDLMGIRLEAASEGRAVFRGTAAFAHTNPVGGVHGGWYGTLLDSAMGCAVMTVVPQGRWYTTLEYKVNLTRALPLGVAVLCEGVVDHPGRSTAVARAEIRGAEDGRLYATGSTTCILLA
ncbi:PaaI family thioesterase [Paracoccaceae bacterium Fryx2]|nr:PaaI family thioesterase [Paracoccaceae bacterium Fryx2]